MNDQLEPRCPCCRGDVEDYPDQDGASDVVCTHCGWREHVPSSADIAAALTLHPPEEQQQVHVCANCAREDSLDEPLPPIEDLWERVQAGEIMPSGECPDCGALCYLETRAAGPKDIEAVTEVVTETVAGDATEDASESVDAPEAIPAETKGATPPVRVIIHVRGGLVQGVCSSDPNAHVSVADSDNAECDPAARDACESFDEEGKKLHGVY